MNETPQVPDQPEDDFPRPGWGLFGTSFGVFAALNLALILGQLVIWGSGVDLTNLESISQTVQLTFAASFTLSFLIVSLGAVLATSGKLSSVGFRPAPRTAALEGIVVGLCILAVHPIYLFLLSWVSPVAHSAYEKELSAFVPNYSEPSIVLYFGLLLLAPIAEEMFFRGFVFGGMRRLGFPLASGLSAVIYGAMHLAPYSTIPLFVFGLATASLYERHRSIFPAMVAHLTFNVASICVDLLSETGYFG